MSCCIMHDIAPVDFVVFTISVCVVTNSEWKTINAGVPQGSILDPVLFLLFINDIVIDIKASIKLFADDTSFYVTVDTPQTAANIINRDLEKIHQWSVNWLV